jgi:hypothetical protein
MEIGFEMPCEFVDHCRLFVMAEQSIVDQDAGQLWADRFGDQCGSDAGVDASRESADDSAISDSLANLFDATASKISQVPIALATSDFIEKIS